jgi:hypothetical protein
MAWMTTTADDQRVTTRSTHVIFMRLFIHLIVSHVVQLVGYLYQEPEVLGSNRFRVHRGTYEGRKIPLSNGGRQVFFFFFFF